MPESPASATSSAIASPTANLSALVERSQKGDRHAADQLFTALYAELHRMARREAYLDISARDALAFPDRAHFMAYAARAMRGVVIDRVRARHAQKRGGGLDITSLDTETADQCPEPEKLTDIGEALDELALLEPALAQVVDLKFFCGFSMVEIAELMGTSERTAQRQWEKARLLLFRAMQTG
jgi:RNA polymerase sigma factor (TIGR02999 family)